MLVSFDPGKDAANKRKHGTSLARASRFDFDTALIREDLSIDYGEIRLFAIGFIDANLYALAYTELAEDHIRAISLRKAEPSERDLYAEIEEV